MVCWIPELVILILTSYLPCLLATTQRATGQLWPEARGCYLRCRLHPTHWGGQSWFRRLSETIGVSSYLSLAILFKKSSSLGIRATGFPSHTVGLGLYYCTMDYFFLPTKLYLAWRTSYLFISLWSWIRNFWIQVLCSFHCIETRIELKALKWYLVSFLLIMTEHLK